MKKQNKKIQKYSRSIYIGLFMMFPILFFGNQLKGTILFDIFGVLALIGAGIEIYYFIKLIKENKKHDKTKK